jgi:phage shock protein A
MNLPVPGTPQAEKLGRFWDSKQGTVMMGVWAGMAAVGLWGLYKALPFIIKGLTMGLQAFGLFALSAVALPIVGVLGIVLTDKRTWLALTYFSANVARRLTSAVINEDPIGSAKTALERMRKRLQDVKSKRTMIVANTKRVDDTIKTNEDERQSELLMAQQALRQNDQRQAEVHAATAQELQDSNEALAPVSKQMHFYAQVFDRVIESGESRLAIFTRKIEIKQRELGAKQAGQSAAASYRAAMKGADADMLAESMDAIGQQIAEAEADMESFMNDIIPQLESDDLKKGANAARGMVSLQQWLTAQNAKPTGLLESGTARTLLIQTGAPVAVTPAPGDPAAVPSGFDAFFESGTKTGEK